MVAANEILGRIARVAPVESAALATDSPLVAWSNAVFYAAEGQPEVAFAPVLASERLAVGAEQLDFPDRGRGGGPLDPGGGA